MGMPTRKMRRPVQLPLALPPRPALGKADFLLAGCNELAVAWLDKYPDWPAPALVLHGPPGCGKSHLLAVWRAATGAVAVEARDLAGADVASLAQGGRVSLDGLEQLRDEEALFHLYNALKDAGGHLLIAAARAPARLALALPDLRSRLMAAPMVEVGAPDDELLGALMVKLFSDRQVQVSPDVVVYLTGRMERSFAMARSLVAALDRAALAERRPITVPLARQVLASFEAEGSKS